MYLNKKEVFLTKTEYMILTYLCFHKNSLVRNNDLNFCLGGGKCIKPSYVLNTHVHNLRKKLHGASWLKTITKYGFMVTV